MVSDTIHNYIAAYAFSPQTGFGAVHCHQQRLRPITTPPVVLKDGGTLTGSRDGTLIGTRYDFSVYTSGWSHLGASSGAPLTRLSEGARVIVSRTGLLTVLGAPYGTYQLLLAGPSSASAATSCNYFYISTLNDFATFDRKSLAQVASVPWVGGGLHSPTIGPSGHVYAIASNVLFVFPPPWDPHHGTTLPSCALSPPTPD